ncbi:hypothetical protein ACMXYX_06205 [Neptuniibacter sp. QD72_48]|uniref:hypothetical protein n=1 Tax=unclassified Neptuniibacter TaxID=2630693 RepID=UPI0039F62595
MKRALIAMFFVGYAGAIAASNDIGTVAIYSDGKVEKLVEKGTGWEVWEDQRKRLYKRSIHPVVPVLSYQKYPDRTQGFTQAVKFGSPEELIPFGKDDVVEFELNRQSPKSGNSIRYWRCTYHGEGNFKLKKKKYKTNKYTCARSAFWKEVVAKVREVHDIEYSPELGLIVSRRTKDRNWDVKKVELEALLTPERATAKRISRIVYKLRKQKRGRK